MIYIVVVVVRRSGSSRSRLVNWKLDVWTISTSGFCLCNDCTACCFGWKHHFKWQSIWLSVVCIALYSLHLFVLCVVWHFWTVMLAGICFQRSELKCLGSLFFIFTWSLLLYICHCVLHRSFVHCNVKLESFFWFVQSDSGLHWYSFTPLPWLQVVLVTWGLFHKCS